MARRTGVTANAVTVFAALGSIAGRRRYRRGAGFGAVFLLLPLWLFLRMALNAIDGMLAREFGQKSPLGAYLNEIGDVVSDAALYAPFALVAPFGSLGVGLVIVLSVCPSSPACSARRSAPRAAMTARSARATARRVRRARPVGRRAAPLPAWLVAVPIVATSACRHHRQPRPRGPRETASAGSPLR